ncbi:8919_t:CDS:2 [Diversispora eburnea]|uniref:8919_t:CDS:1 n=1 Tax=Diversispora eburnea TaxID=1213867 RepID=A0A9N9GK91_9GLOM|nr:8919_t:CDS:2 [Diversispora eburnea]
MNTSDKSPLPNYTSENNSNTPTLYKEKIFNTWQKTFDTIEELISENTFKHVYITTINNTHSHSLNSNIIQFGDNKQIPFEIMKEIEFLTVQCKMGTFTQRQYLEAKFPGQMIYNNDQYNAIQYFRSQSKNDINNAVKLYTRLLELSLHNPMWKISTAAFMFTLINNKLEEYLLPAILKLQKNEIHQSVFYDALQINQKATNEFEKYNFLSDQYLEDLPNAHQITASCIIADVKKEQISSMWANPSKESFLIANKFEDENLPIIPESDIPFLSAVNSTIQDSISNHERLTDIQLYGKITGLTHKVTMKTIRNKDTHIIDILENYLQDENENVDENMNSISRHTEDLESDKENNSSVLKNPNRQTKPKRRPKGTKRLKAFHEKSNTISSGVNK